jgi:hypothetical protein
MEEIIIEKTEEIIIEKTEEIIIEKTEEIIEEIPYCNHGLLKNQRNLILNETDKYMMPDFPLTPEQLIIAKEYRQALRDFTNNNWVLPNKPDFIITMN